MNVDVGEFKDIGINYHGTLTLTNCKVYVGEFKDGKMNGHGSLHLLMVM